MSEFRTEQEVFWAGNFGDEYTDRSKGTKLLASNTALFAEIFSHTQNVGSAIEFGANVGMNLRAIKILLPNAELAAIEINPNATGELQKIENLEVFAGSILEYKPNKVFDLALIKTVLIHIEPDFLPQVYQSLYDSSKRYICIAEYYNPTPTEVIYRGHTGKLFKRDFAGEMLDKFEDLQLLAYGFRYRRDNNFRQDDVNWFLLEKIS